MHIIHPLTIYLDYHPILIIDCTRSLLMLLKYLRETIIS